MKTLNKTRKHLKISCLSISCALDSFNSPALRTKTTKSKTQPVFTALFKMDNQYGPTVQHWNFAQSYVAAWMGGEFGEK